MFPRRFANHKNPFSPVARTAGLLLLSAALLPTGQTNSDDTRSQIPPDVQVRIEIAPKVATVGDPIRFDYDIAAPAGWQVGVLGLEKQANDFSILQGPALTMPSARQKSDNALPAPAGSLMHHHARIIAAVYKTGSFIFPSVRISLRTTEGKFLTVSSPSANIEIQSVLTAKDGTLIDLKKQAELADSGRWRLWAAALLGLALLLGIAWFIRKRRRVRSPGIPDSPFRDPLELAESDLRDLLARGLPEKDLVKEFYVGLSEIVKRILEAGYGIHTAERTTSEIVDSLRRGPERIPEDLNRVESFLLACDMVKFARYIPGKDEHHVAANEAFLILEHSRQSSTAGRQAASVGD